MELIFEIRDAEEGGYHARALGHAIFTEADSWEESAGTTAPLIRLPCGCAT
jgi:hypothetical protein